jgi:septum site-determining protein MinD
VARRLGVPELLLVVNKYAPWLGREVLCRQVEATYGARVAGMFAHADEMLELQSGGVFALHYPEHEFSRGVAAMARALTGAAAAQV